MNTEIGFVAMAMPLRNPAARYQPGRSYLRAAVKATSDATDAGSMKNSVLALVWIEPTANDMAKKSAATRPPRCE